MRKEITYNTYDELGNIMQMKSVSQWTRDYFYNTNDNKLLGHTDGTTEYPIFPKNATSTLAKNAMKKQGCTIYDAHGNILTMPHLTLMEWNYEDMLIKTTKGTESTFYRYDASGERVRKITEKQDGSKEERLYLGGYEVYRKIAGENIEKERTTININDDTKRIATVDALTIEGGATVSNPTANVRYQIDNHLGSASLELNEVAEIISYEEYHPFGTTSYRAGRSDTETSLKRYKYVGKERDEETGLYYYGARYYAAWIARFCSVDPQKEQRSWLNPYNYVQNNPINRIDPDGALDDEWDINIETGETKNVSDKGGSETQYFNIKDDSGKLLTSVSTPGSDLSLNYNSFSIDGDFNANLNISGTNGIDDAKHKINYRQTASEENSFLFSPEMNYIGLGLSSGSIGTGTATTLGNLNGKLRLLDEGKFLANYKGATNTWSLGFKGNQYVSSSLVAAKKSKFMNNIGVLRGLKFAGTGFSFLSTGISATQFAMTDDPAKKLEYGFDTFMGGVGFIGLPGAIASGLYFATKPLQKLNAKYINKAQSGMSDLGKGFHAIQLAPFK